MRFFLPLGLLTFLLAPPALAGSDCDVQVSFVDFGRVDGRRNAEVSGEVSVLCDEATRFVLTLSEGHGSYGERRMRGPGGKVLRYNIYIDPARRQVWGDGAAGTARLAGRNDGRRPTIIPVYGKVARGQPAASGHYSDQLLVSVRR
jgi:spore coat protein U-like protein